MKKLFKAIFMILGVSCIAVLIYFIVIIIGSKGEVVKQYKNMTSASTQGADNIHANFLRVYGTYGEELFIQLGLKKTDYAITGTSDSDTSMPGDKVQSGCTCTSLCTYDSDYDDTCDVCAKDWTQCAYVPPCTCSGPDRCTSGNVDDTCEACKISYTNCCIPTGAVTPGALGGTYDGVWSHCQQGTENYKIKSISGSTGVHCFFIAMNCVASGLKGSTVTLDEVFAADGTVFTITGNIAQSNKDVSGGSGTTRANNILSKLGISQRFVEEPSFSPNGGTYLLHASNDSAHRFSSGGEHWFIVNGDTLMSKAGTHAIGYKLTTSDINYINSNAFNHWYKIQ